VLDRATPDDPAVCYLCGHETSVAMIAVHLEREHGITPEEIANAPILYEDGDLGA
jgi:hypothetical protein